MLPVPDTTHPSIAQTASRVDSSIRSRTPPPSRASQRADRTGRRRSPVADSASGARDIWFVPADRPTQLSFDPGLVIAGGDEVLIFNQRQSAGAVRVTLYGYETSL